MAPKLPPCGLYRTKREVAGIPAGKLVYFHNHGDPGPGLYLPDTWKNNRVRFEETGVTLTDLDGAQWLEPVAPEGLYYVSKTFHCCEQKCVQFEPPQLVQLGYDSDATPILFTPEFVDDDLSFPDEGVRIDEDRMRMLKRLEVPEAEVQEEEVTVPEGHMLH